MRRPSPAFVLALIALIVALSGTGYAATKITSKDVKNNSLTGADIKNNSLRGADIKNNSLRGADIRNGTVGPADLQRRLRNQLGIAGGNGASGQPGAPGAQGAPGPPGPAGSNASINGVAAGGGLTGTYPNPGLGGRSVGPDQLDTPLAAALQGPKTALPNFVEAPVNLESPDPASGSFDHGGYFDPALPDGVTAPRAGVYRVSASVSFDGGDTDAYYRVAVSPGNGAPISNQNRLSGINTILSGSAVLEAGAGERIKVTALATGDGADATMAHFGINYLGPL